jgi:uncharacterized protein (UPF0332 family)
MIIRSEDRKTLSKYRLEQMRTAAASFRILLQTGDLQGATNRLYYAVFYGISTLAVSRGRNFSKHGSLIGWFNREFVLPGLFDRSFGRFVNDAWENRTKSDYDYMVEHEPEQLQQMSVKLDEFMQKISRFVEERTSGE